MIKVVSSNVWDLAAQRKILAVAKNANVAVGIPTNEVYSNGQKVEKVGWSMEFGNGAVLPRPFVRNAEASKKKEWRDTAKDELSSVVKEEKSKKEAMQSIGEKVKRDVILSLDTLTTPPLKESTVAAKRKKGRSRPEKPLIDSGKLRSSIKTEVNC